MSHHLDLLAHKSAIIIEPNETVRDILSQWMRRWQMDVTTFHSGVDAIRAIEAGKQFDLCLSSHQLPDMDGYLFIRRIDQYRDDNETGSPKLILAKPISEIPPTDIPQHLSIIINKPIKMRTLMGALINAFAEQMDANVISHRTFDAQVTGANPLHILLVEDNLINQKIALLMLKKFGYAADIAANGLEAIDALKRQPYDVILMDIHMPEMDGIQATHRILSEWDTTQRPRIIAMTANALQGDRERFLAEGMDDYVSKPINPDALADALSQVRRLTE